MSKTFTQTCRVTWLVLLLSFATTYGLAQSPGKPKPAAPDAHAADNPDILRQMNRALEELAAVCAPGARGLSR